MAKASTFWTSEGPVVLYRHLNGLLVVAVTPGISLSQMMCWAHLFREKSAAQLSVGGYAYKETDLRRSDGQQPTIADATKRTCSLPHV